MKRYIVRTEGQSWLVVDTFAARVIKEYSYEEAALEVAECKNYDEELEIFNEFG
jgi:hypothetical protein